MTQTAAAAPPVLTDRFAAAVAYAAELHADHIRKGTAIPYMSHLLGAASLLLELPGATEDEAIAALLHDAIEDQGDRTSQAEITRRFGADVARIVADCTDADTDPKPPWRRRKVAYLAHLRQVDEPSLRVSLADKMHNATAIARDLHGHGSDLWRRFNAPPPAQRWYYTSLAEVFTDRLDSELSRTFALTVDELFAGIDTDLVLDRDRTRPSWVGADTLTGAAADAETAALETGPLQPTDDGGWRSPDGTWWVEPADAGDPARPLAIFVQP